MARGSPWRRPRSKQASACLRLDHLSPVTGTGGMTNQPWGCQ